MNIRIIKEIVNGLPITGDKITKIENGFAIYTSGGRIKIDNMTRLKVGDIVIGVYHGHEPKDKGGKIIINVDHETGGSITFDSYYSEQVKIRRDYKIDEILKKRRPLKKM